MSASRYLHLVKALLVLLACCICLMLLAPHRVSQLVLADFTHYQCQVNHAAGQETFNIYIPTDMLARQLADELCQHTLAGSRYRNVQISWQPRSALHTRELMQQQYQLFWNREHVLSGMLPDWQQVYYPLLKLPHYEIDWFSQHAGLQLRQGDFSAQRIGLLADTDSQSGYRLPRMQLNELQIAESQLQYFPTREALITAFMAGQLDIIPALPVQLPQWPANQRLRITDQAEMGDWYLSRSVDPALHCSLRDALQIFNPLLQRIAAGPMPQQEACL
ncbi:MAG: hypothetical protein H7A09_10265 [Oceanospirillaceae bacterium]|nr:hypothetical protein [Oceanospirillaceae bacterium]